jgi:hypothetical protein
MTVSMFIICREDIDHDGGAHTATLGALERPPWDRAAPSVFSIDDAQAVGYQTTSLELATRPQPSSRARA